ncbi:hypothetical protein HPMBJEAJ_00146 [Aeromonas phage avDM6]|nr:hypothetical protein HPMBJEAJ_00146 [Aeromonas phage avDM6]
MRLIIIGLMFSVLVACSSKPIPETKLTFHPNRPVAVKTYVPKWTVIKEGDTTFVGMTYEDSLRYRAWLEKIGVYIDSQNRMLCTYRKELNEPQCKKAP